MPQLGGYNLRRIPSGNIPAQTATPGTGATGAALERIGGMIAQAGAQWEDNRDHLAMVDGLMKINQAVSQHEYDVLSQGASLLETDEQGISGARRAEQGFDGWWNETFNSVSQHVSGKYKDEFAMRAERLRDNARLSLLDKIRTTEAGYIVTSTSSRAAEMAYRGDVLGAQAVLDQSSRYYSGSQLASAKENALGYAVSGAIARGEYDLAKDLLDKPGDFVEGWADTRVSNPDLKRRSIDAARAADLRAQEKAREQLREDVQSRIMLGILSGQQQPIMPNGQPNPDAIVGREGIRFILSQLDDGIIDDGFAEKAIGMLETSPPDVSDRRDYVVAQTLVNQVQHDPSSLESSLSALMGLSLTPADYQSAVTKMFAVKKPDDILSNSVYQEIDRMVDAGFADVVELLDVTSKEAEDFRAVDYLEELKEHGLRVREYQRVKDLAHEYFVDFRRNNGRMPTRQEASQALIDEIFFFASKSKPWWSFLKMPDMPEWPEGAAPKSPVQGRAARGPSLFPGPFAYSGETGKAMSQAFKKTDRKPAPVVGRTKEGATIYYDSRTGTYIEDRRPRD